MKNESAFPYVINLSQAVEVTPGLLKREYFAAQIYGDLICDELWKDEISGISDCSKTSLDRIAQLAVKGADALCKALSQRDLEPPTEPQTEEFFVPCEFDIE